jgi:hypothetical protein
MMHCTKNPIYVFPELKLHNLVPNFPTFCKQFIYSQDRSAYLAAAKKGREYINCSQVHEYDNWETEHYDSALEITRPVVQISSILTTLQISSICYHVYKCLLFLSPIQIQISPVLVIPTSSAGTIPLIQEGRFGCTTILPFFLEN